MLLETGISSIYLKVADMQIIKCGFSSYLNRRACLSSLNLVLICNEIWLYVAVYPPSQWSHLVN